MRLDGNTTPIVVAIVLQGLAAIWWASTISADISLLKSFAQRAEVNIRGIDETRFSSDEETKYREEIARRLFTLEESVRDLQTQLKRQH